MHRLILMAAIVTAAQVFSCAKTLPEESPLAVSPLSVADGEERTASNILLVTDSSGTMYGSETFPKGRALSESLIMALKDIAVSSGSACTSSSLEPSYVLRALGREDELAHSSIRFTIGRFSTAEEVDYVVDLVRDQVTRLREMSPLWDMFKDGVDLKTVQWAAH